MKKILIFSLAYYPHMSGAEIAIKEITDRIDPSEIEFHLICNRYDTALSKTERVGNVQVHRIGFGRRGAKIEETYGPLFSVAKALFIPLAALKAASLHRTHRFDGLWAMMLYMTLPIMLARTLGVRVPYVLTVQEGDPFEHVFERWHIRLIMPLLRRAVRRAAAVQAISSHLAEWAKHLGYARTIEVVQNGVNIAHFSQRADGDERGRIREKLSADPHGTVLIQIGRIVPKNGIEDIIKALAVLPKEISFAQIGAGPDKEKLRALADACGVADRVRFLGFIDHAELPKYLSSADIFVQPSLSEGMGNVFIEAFAARVPVVATQEGGIKDFLFDPERDPGHAPTGRAVNSHDPEGVARAVRLYREDRAMRERIIANACALVREKYDWSRIARAMREKVFSYLMS